MSLLICNVPFVLAVIAQSSDASSDSSAIKNKEAVSPSAPITESVSELTATSPVPCGVRIMLLLLAVVEIVWPLMFISSNCASVTGEFVPNVTPSIAPESIYTFVVAC